MDSPHLDTRGLLSCVLCHGDISVRAGDFKKVVSHLEDSHGVNHDMEMLLSIAFLEVHEKEVIKEKVSPRIKVVLDQARLLGDTFRSAEEEVKTAEKRNFEDTESNMTKIPRVGRDVDVIANILDGNTMKIVSDKNPIAENEDECNVIFEDLNEQSKVESDVDDIDDLSQVKEVYNKLKKSDQENLKDVNSEESPNVSLNKDSEVDCKICNLSIPRSSIRAHVAIHYNNGNSRPIMASSESGNVLRPVLSYNNYQQVQCPVCNKAMVKKSLSRHIKKRHPNGSLENMHEKGSIVDQGDDDTDNQDNNVKNMTDLEEDRRKSTEEFTPSGKQEVKCSECNKSMLRSSLSRHFKRHHGNVAKMKEMTDSRERQIIEMREKQRFMSNWARRPEASEKSMVENHETEKERLIQKEPESDLMKRERQMAEVKERLLMISRQRESLETGSGVEKHNLVENHRDLVDKGSLGPGLEARERQLMMMREKQNLMMKAMERQVVEARGKERYDLGEGNEKSKAIKIEAVEREAISKDDSALVQNNSHFNNESMSDNDEQYVLQNQTSAKKNIKEEVEENVGDKTVSSSENDLQGSFSKGPSRAETTMDCEICHINILKKSMPKHMQRKHANTFKCHICNKDFANLDGLKLHTLKNHQLTNDEADTTELINGLQAILNDDNIKNENRFEVDPLNHDDSLNSNNSGGNSGDQTSIAKVTYDCDQCPTKFTHKDSVRRHKRRLHAS